MYIGRGYIATAATYLMDEDGNFIKDEDGNKIIATFLIKATYSSSYSAPSSLIHYYESQGFMITASQFLKDEYGDYITDEFGNKIATRIIPDSIYSSEHYRISLGKIEFWGSGKYSYRFISETAY